MTPYNEKKCSNHLVGVTEQSGWATAFETARFVDALSSRSARIVSAFIDVDTPNNRISSMARFAHAFRRIGRRAFRVDSTSVAFAWALTLVAILGIDEIGWRADALAWLDAALIGAAFSIGETTDERRSADSLVRLAGSAGRAATLVTARPVDALGAESAS